jgi:chemotaxis protein methyltransferase CheR
MLIDQTPAIMNGLSAEILGTDISDRVLEKARTGVYTQFEVQRGLSIQMLMKYFEKKDDQWRISDKMRASVRFQPLNLLSDFRFLGRFDVVFCRNVLIYFDAQTKRDILERMARQMPDDGVLLLGAAETVLGLTEAFKPAAGKRGLYVRNASWKKAAA